MTVIIELIIRMPTTVDWVISLLCKKPMLAEARLSWIPWTSSCVDEFTK